MLDLILSVLLTGAIITAVLLVVGPDEGLDSKEDEHKDYEDRLP